MFYSWLIQYLAFNLITRKTLAVSICGLTFYVLNFVTFFCFKFLFYIFNLLFCHFDSIVIMSDSFGGKVSSPVVVTSDSSLCRAFNSNFLLWMMQKPCSFLDFKLQACWWQNPALVRSAKESECSLRRYHAALVSLFEWQVEFWINI